MQPFIQVSNGYNTILRVAVPVIQNDHCVGPSEISGTLKWQLPLDFIPGTLLQIEFNFYVYNPPDRVGHNEG